MFLNGCEVKCSLVRVLGVAITRFESDYDSHADEVGRDESQVADCGSSVSTDVANARQPAPESPEKTKRRYCE